MNNFSDDNALIDQFGYQVAARLYATTDSLPHDITERLRAARYRAVEKRKWVLLQGAPAVFGRLHAGLAVAQRGTPNSWWNRIGIAGLLLTLVLGLFVINTIQDEMGARELADIDAALLTDDLPPSAYVDPGFAQFLKVGDTWER